MLLKRSNHRQKQAKRQLLLKTDVDICDCTRMTDDFGSQEVRSSGELWSEICSSLPEVQEGEAAPENNTEFNDSFQPAAQDGVQVNGHSNGTDSSSPSAKWEPMEDSEIYIASLGIVLLLSVPVITIGPMSHLANLCLLSTRSCHPLYNPLIQEVCETIGFQNPSTAAQLLSNI